MPKVTGPAFAISAWKSLKKTITYQRRPSGHAVQIYQKPGGREPTTATPGQTTQRAAIGTLVSDWQALSPIIRELWDQEAVKVGYQGVGYHYFIHQGGRELSNVILRDDFRDESFDTSKWTESTNAGSHVTEQNNRLQFESDALVSAFIRSNIAHSPKNTIAYLKVEKHCNDGGFKFCPTVVVNHQWDVYSESNWYNHQLIGSSILSPNKRIASVGPTQIGGDSPALTAPYWMRMRVDNSKIYFDYCNQINWPREDQWINISSEVWNMPAGIDQPQYIYMTAYNTPTTGPMYVSDFVWIRNE